MSAVLTAGPTMARMPRIARELNAVVAVAARDITVTLKTPATVIVSLAMPLLMMGMIGGNLMANMTAGLGFGLGKFMLVGMLVTMMFMTTTLGMASLVDDSDANYSAELLVAPVSRYAIIIGKVLGSSFSALTSCLGVLLVGLAMGISLSGWQLLTLLALAPLMCLSGGALAMIVMGLIKSNKTANIAVMLITMPQMFLSGAIIPIAHSSGILFVLSRIMPMTYCVDLGRAIVYAGSPEYSSVVLFNPVVSLLAISGLTVVSLVAGTVCVSGRSGRPACGARGCMILSKRSRVQVADGWSHLSVHSRPRRAAPPCHPPTPPAHASRIRGTKCPVWWPPRPPYCSH